MTKVLPYWQTFVHDEGYAPLANLCHSNPILMDRTLTLPVSKIEQQNIKITTKLQSITIPTFNFNIQIGQFKTKSHILNTLPTYKYIYFN